MGTHQSVLGKTKAPDLTDEQRLDQGLPSSPRVTLPPSSRRRPSSTTRSCGLYAARGLIGTGIAGGIEDIDRVVERIEQKGIRIGREHVALVVGMTDGVVRSHQHRPDPH